MENGLFDMWDYARMNAKTPQQAFDSFADDLDASVGIGQWRMSKNINEQPKRGERAVVFMGKDGDAAGDFVVFIMKDPKVHVVYACDGEPMYVCWSARQADVYERLERAVRPVQGGNDMVFVKSLPFTRPKKRIDMAQEYCQDEESSAAVAESDVLDADELQAHNKPVVL